jgi:hypothetical protein
MGIDWWSHSAFLSSGAPGELTAGDIRPIDVELRDLRNRVDRLERTS